MSNNDERDAYFMCLALEQARRAEALGEVPIGAVIAGPEGVIATGFNQPCMTADPTAHAEIVALRSACLKNQNYRLNKDLTLYVTLEPCLMCTGALIQARIGRVVFAAQDSRPQSIHRQYNLFQSESFNHHIAVQSGVRSDEAQALLAEFFEKRR